MSTDPKPKRGFKTISSNGTSYKNDEKNKKNRADRKTLGMAWGAGASANSRSGNSPFSDFGSYMIMKNWKLHAQFDAAANSSHSGSTSADIFCGVSIFVDGYTVPSSQELRGYMLKHGGRFENYFSRHLVTHIICSNLPDSKIKNLRAFSGGLPIVKPAWVLDSIAANKLLNWIPYQLDQLASENYNQPKLSAFFTSKKNVNGACDISNLNVDNHTNQPLNSSSEEYTFLDQADGCSVEHSDLLQVDFERVISEDPPGIFKNSPEVKGSEMSDCSPIDEENPVLELKSSRCQANFPLCGIDLDDHINEASTSRISLPPNQRHSTLSDPNFVENYFKSSRLHFIGTWRNRYRKRFAHLSNGHRCERSVNSTPENEKVCIHIDMDCFFVSVVVRNHPELLDKPVAVCHSDTSRGTGEISSANYIAREQGVKAGMFVKDAKNKCPQLVIVPYNFGAYEMVADQFYEILNKHCKKVQAVSCDEAFLDVSESELGDPQLLASIIRKEIFDITGCTASAGIAGNMLMARLATKTAKPNGQCYIPSENVEDYLCTLPVKALPGIGHVLEEKLKIKKIDTCGQLRLFTKESLQKDFGMKTGEMLWNYSRGIDNRLVGVMQESKSIGADVNWGVRFRNSNDVQHFLTNLCKEISLRLQGCGVQGRSFTLKVKKKKSDAGEPMKYMGHGDCENMSHTITIPAATDDVDVLQRLATQLFGHFHIDVKDIRGVGLQVSKLERADDSKLGPKRNSILPWLVSMSANATDQLEAVTRRGSVVADAVGQPSSNIIASCLDRDAGLSRSESGVPQTTNLPPLHDLDVAVIESLPPEVVSEINDMYGGKLLGFISQNKSRCVNSNICTASTTSELDAVVKNAESLPGSHAVELNTRTADSEVIRSGEETTPTIAAAPFSVENIMPSSLSQVDYSVWQQLPDEFRKDIIELLPHHREPEVVEGSTSNVAEKETILTSAKTNELWDGDPPKWIELYKTNNCSIFSYFAQVYQSGSGGGCLSSLLQHIMSTKFLAQGMVTDGTDAVGLLCDIFTWYIELKISTDIEEIYTCICLLRRLTVKSEVFLQVLNFILPRLQALMGEKYGGTLSIPSS